MITISPDRNMLTKKVCGLIEKSISANTPRGAKIFLNRARKEWDNDFGPRVSNYSFIGFCDDYITVLNTKKGTNQCK